MIYLHFSTYVVFSWLTQHVMCMFPPTESFIRTLAGKRWSTDRTRALMRLRAKAAFSFVLHRSKLSSMSTRWLMSSSPGIGRRRWNFRRWKSHRSTITMLESSRHWNIEYCNYPKRYYTITGKKL